MHSNIQLSGVAKFAGATNGISKNFDTVKEVLKDFVDIHEPGKGKAPAKVCSTFYTHDCSGFIWLRVALTAAICGRLQQQARRQMAETSKPSQHSPEGLVSLGGLVSWTDALLAALNRLQLGSNLKCLLAVGVVLAAHSVHLAYPFIPVWMSALSVVFCRVTITQRWSQHDSHLHGCSLNDLHLVSPSQHCARSPRMADKLSR